MDKYFDKDKNDNKTGIGHCYFCVAEEADISYKDIAKLKRFLNENGMIVSRQKTKLCAAHQRKLTLSVKKARFLALLPVGGRKNANLEM